ncbi:MAG: sulfatase [Kiritimatiellae bacterium]|nr:sulfatase [Kiritimatiellia bacterium]
MVSQRWVALLAALVLRAGAATPEQRLNILFIFADDHTTQAVSAYGHPLKLVATPNIDRIAQGGVLFERCLVPNSICGPSRAALLTAKYSHANGFYRNGNRFDGSQTTFPKLLRAAGYQTAVIGKWHLESDPTGFDHWEILPGQGAYYNPPMIRDGVRVRHEGYTTDIITDLSLEWLRRRDTSRPFLLMCHHKAPHRPWMPALRHLGWSGDRRFPEPPTLFDDYRGRGRPEREQDMTLRSTFNDLDAKLKRPGELNEAQAKVWDAYYEPRNRAFREAKLGGDELVRWRYQRYMHDYLGCVLAVDEGVGRLLDWLETEGLAENTVVVYSSDQGFFLGEHGWFDKRWIYEESLTTPLLVRAPGVARAGSRCGALVSVLDLAPTLLELAGVSVPADLHGRSLVPLLRGETPADWRKSFYYHYYEYPGPHSVRKHYGVVTDRYKLFHFYEAEVNEWRLIDRHSDPDELRDVYADPAYAEVRERLLVELQRLRTELRVPEEDPPESLARPGAGRGGARPAAKGSAVE